MFSYLKFCGYLSIILTILAGQLYWTDRHRNCIETSDLNGGNRRIIATENGANLMSIAIHGQYLYYTAWNRQ